MQRLVFALLIGVGLALTFSGSAAGQPDKDKPEKAPPPKTVGHERGVLLDGPFPLQVVTAKLSFPEMVFAFLVLFALTMIFFQLLLVRSTLEKILERQGGTP